VPSPWRGGPAQSITTSHTHSLYDALESTLKRHRYYCRQKRSTDSSPVTRPRSCVACAKKNRQCDNERPQCSRCSRDGVGCHFPTAAPSKTTTVPRNQHGDTLETPSTSINTFRDALQVTNDDTNLASLEGLQFDWNNLDIDLDAFLLPQDNSMDVFSTPRQKSPYPSSISLAPACPLPLPRQVMPSSAIPVSPTNSPRSLVRKRNARPGAPRAANMVLHTMKSYSVMMLQQNNLPPFIHPQMFSFNDDKDMEPLYNCISLMHMIGRRLPGCRALFWRSVRMECERMQNNVSKPGASRSRSHDEYLHWKHRSMNSWEVVASLQALSTKARLSTPTCTP
jgi:hypothetical protein